MRYGKRSLVVGLSLVTFVLVTADRRARSQAQPTSDTLVVRGGTVLDVQQGRLLPNMDIVVQGERITQVVPTGQVNTPAGAQVIEATGKFVLPGLWDTHAHTRDYDGALNIHFGVTSTMDMGNLMDWSSLFKRREKSRCHLARASFLTGWSSAGNWVRMSGTSNLPRKPAGPPARILPRE